MWHRLPFEQKRRPAGYEPRVERRRAGAGVDRHAAGPRHARRRSRATSRSVGQRRPRAGVDVAAFQIERHDVTNARFLEFVEAGGYARPALVAPGRLAWVRRRARSRIRSSGSATSDRLALARHVRSDAAAAGVAGVRQPRGGLGVRALARRAPADRGRVPARGVRHARRRARASVGRRRARRPSTACSTSPAGIRSRPAAIPAGASAWGVEDLVGNGWEWTSTRVRAVSRLPRDGVVSGVLGRLLRRRALRHEGRVAGDRARAAAADLPQLVPPALSVRLRDLPLRRETVVELATAVRPRGSSPATSQYYLALDAAAAAVALLLRRARLGALRGDLPRCPWYRITRAELRAARRARRARSSRTCRAALTHRRARPRQRREAGGARRRPAARRRPPSTCTWSTSPPTRARLAEPRAARPRATSRSWLHEATYEAGLAEVTARRAGRRARRSRSFSARTSATSIRRGADAFLRGIRAALAPRRRAAPRRRSREAGARAARWPTTIRSASPRRSTGTCSCASTASSAATSTSTQFAHRARLERRRVARRDAPGQPRRASACACPAPRSTSRWRRARRSGPRAPTSTSPAGSSRMLGAAGFPLIRSGSTTGPVRVDAHVRPRTRRPSGPRHESRSTHGV